MASYLRELARELGGDAGEILEEAAAAIPFAERLGDFLKRAVFRKREEPVFRMPQPTVPEIWEDIFTEAVKAGIAIDAARRSADEATRAIIDHRVETSMRALRVVGIEEDTSAERPRDDEDDDDPPVH